MLTAPTPEHDPGLRQSTQVTETNEEMRHIPDNELRLEMVPKSDAGWHTIQEFALTFDGYGLHGSFEKCAEIANSRRHETIGDLRTCLFFEQRRWRHFGEAPNEEAIGLHSIGTRQVAHASCG